MTRVLATLLLLALAACHEEPQESAAPPPQEISDEAIGQFCGMILTEHPGPKAQIFARDQAKPVWFASVRDAIAYTMLPELPRDVTAIYVSDMARAHDWDQPEPGTWVEAHKALYVIGSRRKSGMDTDEAVPFGEEVAARRFAMENGGRVVPFADIPQSYILGSGGNGS
ncbi:MAG: nitrous oxide reductase accessory protein NosL [Hyphomicrobiales bacterium]